MSKKKTLHVPDAPFRPGEKPDFSHLELPKAGDAKKPKIMVEWILEDNLNVRFQTQLHKSIWPDDTKGV